VGLLDADVYGPSVPHLLGLSGRPRDRPGQDRPPRHDAGGGRHGADGRDVDGIHGAVGRGRRVAWPDAATAAITQMLRDTLWGPLDYLIIDMPPGTGDIALTLSQALPLTGAVVVCTPQDVALLDATKAIAMFRKVDIPILGMVENMSFFVCPTRTSGTTSSAPAARSGTAKDLEIPFLGEVPIQIPIREHGDAGKTCADV